LIIINFVINFVTKKYIVCEDNSVLYFSYLSIGTIGDAGVRWAVSEGPGGQSANEYNNRCWRVINVVKGMGSTKISQTG
jgi:hypothetical protein